ncbi:protein FAM189B isoform X2 [Varanus komodoensis]|uniref:protein FAM189B isoform X2 n=1 Tax=Varanus komodoensis TaxID=61221 RepID=UPI001CF7AA26|nr:protein FAM189B isoform X2 [Varanus komodoensis]
MPSRSDSSYSLTARTSRSFTHLRVQRSWLQILLLLGFIQMILGVLIVTLSLLVTTNMPSQHPIRSSCPIWAGFPLAFSGVVGIVSWRRPFTPVITFFTLLSVLGVMLSLAGSILSCQYAQQMKSLEACERLRQRDGSSDWKEQGWRRSLRAQFNSPYKKCVYASSEPGFPACGNNSEPNSNCSRVLLVLKDLLFSVCGLTIFAIVVCTLSAIMCCIQIFSLDVLHALSPPRSSSVTLDCTSPPDTFLHHMLDLDEFVPPVPPPPYYPPEYTCSSETDAQSITYNGSMDSPVPLYPTDFPPSYEAVMGLHGDSQVTLFDSQFTDTSHGPCSCNQVPSVVLSGEAASMDSGSLVMSEIVDIPGDSSPSEDSCLLDVSGSACSVDYVLFRSIQRSRADYCLSVDCGQCGLHPQGPFEETPQVRHRGERSYSCSTPGTGYEGLLEACSAHTHSCHRLEGLGHSIGPCFPEVRVKAKTSVPGRKGPGRRQRRSSEASCRLPSIQCPLLRSHSDPGISMTNDAEGDFQEVFCTKASEDEGSNSSTDAGPYSEAGILHPSLRGPPSQCQLAGKTKLEVPQKVPQHLSKTTTRSLGDLKVCRGTRGLMARFLHRSKRSLVLAGVETAGRSGTRGRKQVLRMGAERCPPEGIHLQSCGDLSSTSSLRRLFSGRRLERRRPHSLSGLIRESNL